MDFVLDLIMNIAPVSVYTANSGRAVAVSTAQSGTDSQPLMTDTMQDTRV